MQDLLNQIGLFATILGLPVALYTYWESKQIKLTATAEPVITFKTEEFPFVVTIVNKRPRQARLDKIGFKAKLGTTYEVRYAIELLETTNVILTDGEKVQ